GGGGDGLPVPGSGAALMPRFGYGGTAAIPASTWRAAKFRFTKQHRPPSVPIEAYTGHDWGPLSDPQNSAVFPASGTVTVQVGPSGLGTLWKVTQAAISTTLGANDASTATLYAGQKGLATVVAAQSYAGGGDSGGLNDAVLYPGQYVICTWTGGTAGDPGPMVVYAHRGRLSALRAHAFRMA